MTPCLVGYKMDGFALDGGFWGDTPIKLLGECVGQEVFWDYREKKGRRGILRWVWGSPLGEEGVGGSSGGALGVFGGVLASWVLAPPGGCEDPVPALGSC